MGHRAGRRNGALICYISEVQDLIPTCETMVRPPTAAAEAVGIIARDGNLTSGRPGSIRCRDSRGTCKRLCACRGHRVRRRLQLNKDWPDERSQHERHKEPFHFASPVPGVELSLI